MKDVPKARGRGRDTPRVSERSVRDQVEFALTWLKRHGTRATREGMARYAIPSHHAYGVAILCRRSGATYGRRRCATVNDISA